MHFHKRKTILRESGRPRRALLRLLAATFVTAIGANVNAQSSSDSTDAVHAAFLFNFAKFTTWPYVNDLDTSVKFCVESNTLDPSVFAGWGKKKVQNRPVRVVFFEHKGGKDVGNCSIMFLRNLPEGETVASMTSFAASQHTLLVSDNVGFGKSGGHIELFITNRRLRFKVNIGALTEARLSLGAGVLNLAEIVSTEGAKK